MANVDKLTMLSLDMGWGC